MNVGALNKIAQMNPVDAEELEEFERYADSVGQSGLRVANQDVVPGAGLSPQQKMAIRVGLMAGNTYPPEIMRMMSEQNDFQNRPVTPSPLPSVTGQTSPRDGDPKASIGSGATLPPPSPVDSSSERSQVSVVQPNVHSRSASSLPSPTKPTITQPDASGSIASSRLRSTVAPITSRVGTGSGARNATGSVGRNVSYGQFANGAWKRGWSMSGDGKSWISPNGKTYSVEAVNKRLNGGVSTTAKAPAGSVSVGENRNPAARQMTWADYAARAAKDPSRHVPIQTVPRQKSYTGTAVIGRNWNTKRRTTRQRSGYDVKSIAR